VRQRRLRYAEHREEVRLERAQQLVLRDVDDFLVQVLFSGVVDQDVELAEPVDGLLDKRFGVRRISQIPPNEQRLAPFLRDRVRRFLGVLVLLEVGDRDVTALPREQHRNSPPDPAVTTGDDRNLALEARGPRIARPEHRTRIEPRFAAWQARLFVGLRYQSLLRHVLVLRLCVGPERSPSPDLPRQAASAADRLPRERPMR